MAAEGVCAACGSRVERLDENTVLCTNRQCPAGGYFQLCQFCGQHTLACAPDQTKCYNPDCRLYMLQRGECPACRYASLITFRGASACMNWRGPCTSNRQTIQTCGACGNASLVQAGQNHVCVKRDCENQMRAVGPCDVCGKMSVDQDAGRCRNKSCRAYNVKTGPCSACGKRAVVNDPGQPKRATCLACGRSESPPQEPRGETVPLKGTRAIPAAPAGGAEAAGNRGSTAQPVSRQASPAPAQDRPKPPPGPAGPVGAQQQAALAAESPSAKGPATSPPKRTPWDKSAPPASPGGARPSAAPPASEEQPTMDQIAKGREAASRLRAPDRGTKTDASIIEAFEFVRDYILSDKDREYPVFLVVGLSGAGKTTYLTMLGEILRTRGTKYYFPFEGIEARQVNVKDLAARREQETGVPQPPDLPRYRRRIMDLVFDFAKDNYSRFLGKTLWAGATPREVPGGEVATHFLVAEVTRHVQTIAKVVTLETSGEDYEDVLRTIRDFRAGDEAQNPLHQVLHELLDLAEGIVVLAMPDDARSDGLFHDFFLMIKEALEPRGLNRLREIVRDGIVSRSQQQQASGAGKGDIDELLRRITERKQVEEQKKKDRQREGEKLIAALRELDQQLGSQGVSAVEAPQVKAWLDGLRADFKALEPNLYGRVTDLLTQRVHEHEKDQKYVEGLFVAYYRDLIKRLAENMPRIMLLRQQKRTQETGEQAAQDEAVPEDLWNEVLVDIRTKYNLSRDSEGRDFTVARQAVLQDERSVRGMQKLKRIAVVVTQTDMYPVVWPSENFPGRSLPQCKMHLAAIDNWLKLCEGPDAGVRYYNSSATGYTMLRDTLYYPGKENTQTPINILEPLFDMLGLKAP